MDFFAVYFHTAGWTGYFHLPADYDVIYNAIIVILVIVAVVGTGKRKFREHFFDKFRWGYHRRVAPARRIVVIILFIYSKTGLAVAFRALKTLKGFTYESFA